MSEGSFYALAVLSTLAGNLLVVGSLANIIAVERARDAGVVLTFAEHARCGVPMTLCRSCSRWPGSTGWAMQHLALAREPVVDALSSRNCRTSCAIFEAPTRVDVR